MAESKLKVKPRRRTSESATKSPARKAMTVKQQQEQQVLDDDELDQALNIRVKERDPSDTPGGRSGRSNRRLGQLFRDPSPAASAIKESIKRPLSSLLRRPGSRSGNRKKEPEPEGAQENGHINIDENELDELAASVGTTGKKEKTPIVMATEPEELDTNGQRRNASIDLGNEIREPSPEIPMLQDTIASEIGGDQIAMAPSVQVNRVASYRELDNELLKHAAFSTLEDVDLSLLTRFLCPESEIKDETVSWTWDYLYTSICSELREEWLEDQEAEGAEEAETQPADRPSKRQIDKEGEKEEKGTKRQSSSGIW